MTITIPTPVESPIKPTPLPSTALKIRQVLNFIEADPRCLSMDRWRSRSRKTGCFACWVVEMLAPGLNVPVCELSNVANRLLGLEPGDVFLFSVSLWPDQFRLRYWEQKSQQGRFEVLRDRMEHFIATGD